MNNTPPRHWRPLESPPTPGSIVEALLTNNSILLCHVTKITHNNDSYFQYFHKPHKKKTPPSISTPSRLGDQPRNHSYLGS